MKSLITFLFFTSASLLLAQPDDFDYSILSITPEMKEGAESVVRYHNYRHIADTDHSSTVEVTKVVTLLSDESRENQLVVYYDDDRRVSKIKAIIYDAFGNKVREAKKSEIEDVLAVSSGQFYEDNRVKTITLEHSTYPYTVAFSYSVKQSEFSAVHFPTWSPQSYNQSCQYASLTVAVPEGNELLFTANQLPDPVISNGDGQQYYNWKVENLPAVRYEPYAPLVSKALPFVKTNIRDFHINEFAGTYASWEDFGKFNYALQNARRKLPPELKQEVNALVADATTNAEKVDRLYKFMQDRVRYVGVQLGIGGWQPFSAEYVDKNRYGDCKALSNYMGSMLEEVGIEAYNVLVYSGRPWYAVTEDFPTSSFNHMILYVPSEDTYLECTSSYAPTGYLGEGTHNRHVLHITPEGGKLARTPALEPTDHGHLRRQDITMKEDGTAQLSIKTDFFGAEQEDLRYLSHALTPEKIKEWLHGNDYLPDLSGHTYDFKVADNKPEAAIIYETSIPRYARKMGKRLFIPLNKYFAYDDLPVAISERKLPVVFDESRFFVDTIQIELPATYQLESKGKELIDITHAAGEYHASTEVKGNTLLWTRTLKLFPVDLPAEEYTAYRDFFVKVSKADRRQLVMKVKSTR